MLSFVIRRLLVSIPVIILASILVFLLVANSGDPLGELKGRNPPVPPQVLEARRHELNLDKPLPQRYWHWATGFVRGDMGNAVDGREVRPLLFERVGVTMRMVALSILLALVLAIGTGVISAIRQYTASDYVFTFAGFLFLSMPVFWLAALLKYYVAIPINQATGSQILLTIGDRTPNMTGSAFEKLVDYGQHLALPTIALALIGYASWSRYQRSTMLDVMSSDYIRLARAKGLSRSRVLVRHALRNALIPLVTVVAIDIGTLLGGAVLTEAVFAWKGMGDLLVRGVRTIDINVVLAWMMVTSLIVVLFNLVADILYAVLDPRIRYG